LSAAPRASAAPPPDVAPAIAGAVHYLRFAQNADGGFGAAQNQSSSSPLYSGWAALGLAAAGRNPRDVDQRRRSSIDYISRYAGTTDVGALERTLLVLGAAGMRPVLGGHNLLARLIGKQHSDGSFDTLN